MSESWTWTCLDADGTSLEGVATSSFPTQADAEAYLAQSWEELADAGVEAVSLRRDGEQVYGPMSLSGE